MLTDFDFGPPEINHNYPLYPPFHHQRNDTMELIESWEDTRAMDKGSILFDSATAQEGIMRGTDQPPLNDPMVKFMRMLADVWLTIPISMLGILGNIVSFIVLCQNHKQRLRSITILLQVMLVTVNKVCFSISFSLSPSVWHNPLSLFLPVPSLFSPSINQSVSKLVTQSVN